MRQYIDVIAPKYQLPPQLVAAIAQVESAGDRFAMRVEPAYPYLWDVSRKAPYNVVPGVAAHREPPADFKAVAGSTRATEWIGQQTSWGYMQVMGAVARELGHLGHFAALSDPLVGLNFGCRHLANLRRRFFEQHGWRGVAAAYNAGTPRRIGDRYENQDYVDKIDRADGFRGIA